MWTFNYSLISKPFWFLHNLFSPSKWNSTNWTGSDCICCHFSESAQVVVLFSFSFKCCPHDILQDTVGFLKWKRKMSALFANMGTQTEQTHSPLKVSQHLSLSLACVWVHLASFSTLSIFRALSVIVGKWYSFTSVVNFYFWLQISWLFICWRFTGCFFNIALNGLCL